ncbi:MAG: aminopeptidase P N-terminal domain-containing protein [Gemmatimonadaceae bacterium]
MSARCVLAALALSTAVTAHAQIPQSEYAARRAALASRMPNGVLVAFGAREPAQDYLSFFQGSHFMYLTGFREPDAALVMVKRNGQVAGTIFVQPREPAQEVWTGARAGAESAAATTGLAGQSAAQFRAVLDSLVRPGDTLSVVSDLASDDEAASVDALFVRALIAAKPGVVVNDAGAAVSALRARKSAAELALIRKAVEITAEAQRDAIRAVEPGMNEFEIQALIEYTFRRNGADRPSFSTIVGSGPNSTTLHYNADDRFMNAGETVVMDIGASYRGYAADVTRTIPVSGTFTPDQRAIYQLVRDAQAAAERQAKLGNARQRMTDSANAVLAAGLAKLGLTESPAATFDCEMGGQRGLCAQSRMYYMHGLGHGIGLDVHDPDAADNGRFAPGSAFTIEPGIYVRADVLDVLPDTPRNREIATKLRAAVERYRNIGVRIEDDYIVTESGVEWISRAPREIAEIEALMKEQFAGPGKRNPAMVDWYRATGGK